MKSTSKSISISRLRYLEMKKNLAELKKQNSELLIINYAIREQFKKRESLFQTLEEVIKTKEHYIRVLEHGQEIMEDYCNALKGDCEKTPNKKSKHLFVTWKTGVSL